VSATSEAGLNHPLIIIKNLHDRSLIMTYVKINRSQVEIRLSNIDQAKEFMKKILNCKSQILSDNQAVLIYPIDQIQRMPLLI
jgi:hypothetical protein